MEWFDCTDPDQLIVIATVVSLGIAKNLSNGEINSLGNFFQLIGQNLETIAAQRVLYEDCSKNNHDDEENSSGNVSSNTTMPGSDNRYM